jgi:hypothetical protein
VLKDPRWSIFNQFSTFIYQTRCVNWLLAAI